MFLYFILSGCVTVFRAMLFIAFCHAISDLQDQRYLIICLC